MVRAPRMHVVAPRTTRGDHKDRTSTLCACTERSRRNTCCRRAAARARGEPRNMKTPRGAATSQHASQHAGLTRHQAPASRSATRPRELRPSSHWKTSRAASSRNLTSCVLTSCVNIAVMASVRRCDAVYAGAVGRAKYVYMVHAFSATLPLCASGVFSVNPVSAEGFCCCCLNSCWAWT